VTDPQGYLKVLSLDCNTSAMLEIRGRLGTVPLIWLRGTKNQVDYDSIWMVVAERLLAPNEYAPVFISQRNTPPIVSLTASTLAVTRGTPILVDASGTTDRDQDFLTFDWEVIDVSPADTGNNITLVTDGPRATLLVAKGIGPAEHTFKVKVSVQDLGVLSEPLTPAPVVQTLTFSVPFMQAPTISWPTFAPIRNSIFKITPTITPANSSDLVYSWTQTLGTPMIERPVIATGETSPGVTYSYLLLTGEQIAEEFDTSTNKPTLQVPIFGAKVLGEQLGFTLTVDDGCNTVVSSTAILQVPSVSLDYLDVNRLNRMFWLGGGGTP